MSAEAPRADKRPVTSEHHGVTLVDDYAWLRADNWQEVIRDPAVLPADIRAHLEAENAWCDAAMADTVDLQARLVAEMRGRIKEDDSSVPAPHGPYAYGSRYLEGAQYPRFVRSLRDGGPEEVLLDGDALATGKAYFHLGGVSHSPDHRLLAWSLDDKGSEFHVVRVKDLDSGADLADEVPNTAGGVAWAADGKSFLYTWLNDNHRSEKVFRHVIGTPAEADVLVYREPDPGFFTGVGKTQSGRFLVIESHDHETSEIRVVPAADPAAEPRLVAARESEVEYSIEDDGADRFYILTNADGAEDFKIVAAPVEAPGRENWVDVVAHEPGRLILTMIVYRGRMVRLERKDGLPRIVIRELSSGAEHAIAFPEEAYSLGLVGGYEFDTTVTRFSYSSPTTPAQVYDYDMATRERFLRKTQEVPSGHEPSDYVTRRIFAPAADGAKVPVTILHHRDTAVDGSAPLLLYGYGAYGIAMPAGFSTKVLSLVDRGFVYAIAHVRGGTDKGHRWYKDGKREKKTNTFTDFVAAAEHLVAERYTARGRIVAQGGSAGGMLMGAVANMAPDLFAGILAVVPFVDVLNTMLDDTLPLTPPEWPEWGNPIESAEDFARIRSYSPYDNVAAEAYPPILAMAGLTDPRVTYWEPAKWVAKLRELSTGDALLLLRTNMDAGHGGASGRFDGLKEDALEYAFALKVTGKA
ncbi:S9 family peptidase [Oharaeibacter diazotrophicus]|uniref:Oligopeptidase B n=1 Tax=Oharaeibacter diazotrophicus TaxID=1920512 RepID=A0A4R6RAX0_9HYPH|nr:S9 family peptidase [Oharaeibacter diazotrophicus]TDP83260.1 oligopeptidase B [Oharaeibacter diazotrophicus]BBE72093.1 protease 2 [Pleomorphomonas sp. SM30]GLS78858.1 oligopeptidase B [Oharaeibacter diazotrophicus]